MSMKEKILERIDKLKGESDKKYDMIHKLHRDINSIDNNIYMLQDELDVIIRIDIPSNFNYSELSKDLSIKWKLTLNHEKKARLSYNHYHNDYWSFIRRVNYLYEGMNNSPSYINIKLYDDVYFTLDSWGSGGFVFEKPDLVGKRLKELGITNIHKNVIEEKFKNGKMGKRLRDTGEIILKSMKIDTTC